MSVYAANSAVAAQQQQRQQHQQRLGELLEAVKQEFDFALNEATNFKQVKEDYDLKYNQQTAEMQQIRQTVYELEMAHRKIKEAYEEEILRLKTELDNRDRQQMQKMNGAENRGPVPSFGVYPQPQILPVVQPQKPPVVQPAAPIVQTLPAPITKAPGAPVEPKVESPKETKIEPIKQDTSTASEEGTLESSSGLIVVDRSQYIVKPSEKASHLKETPPFLTDLDVNKANPEFRKQNPDYFVLYNPAFERNLDIELVHSLDHSSVVCCVKFSKNDELVATGCNKTTQVFNVKTGELVAKLVDDSTSHATIDENGTNGDGHANDVSSTTNSKGDLYIRSVCFSPDGKLLATGAEDKLIRIWDLSTKKIVKVLRGHEQDIYSLDFFPDGNRLVSGSGDRTVRIWDLRYSQCSLTLSIEDGVTTVAVSPDGQLIAAGSLDRTVRVWDPTTGYLVERLDSGNDNGNGHEDSVYSVSFSSTGKHIASGSLDRTVKLWRLEDKQEGASSENKKASCQVTYVGHSGFVLSVCTTPDNQYTLSGSRDRGVIFWDQMSGNPILMLQGHRNSVIAVSVSLNSTGNEGLFATGSGDCKARIWRWKKTN